MSAPYRDHLAAIRAALNVDARSLYKPAGWQHLAMIGYREELPPAPGDLNKLERFQQDCMTYAFLNQRMPPVQWAAIIVRHGLRVTDPKEQAAEFDRLKWAVLACLGHVDYPDRSFAIWAIRNWGGKLPKDKASWSQWQGHESAVSTLKRHYREQIVNPMDSLLHAAENNAHRLLSDGGLIERVAA